MLKFKTMALVHRSSHGYYTYENKKKLQSFKSDAVSVPQTLSLNSEIFLKVTLCTEIRF